MRIATWNCNSIRSRVDRAVALLERHDLDVLALQESLSLMGEIESAWNAIPSDQRQRPAVTGA